MINKSVFTVLNGLYESHVAAESGGLSAEDHFGHLLFILQYNHLIRSSDITDNFIQLFEQLIIKTHKLQDYSYTKRIGINWLYNYMRRKDIIDSEYIAYIGLDNKTCFDKSLDFLQKGNYDFLYGANGIAHYLLHANSSFCEQNFNHYFSQLNVLFRNENEMPQSFDLDDNSVKDEVDIGLAHGIVSILKLCVECIRKKICVVESSAMANKIAQYLINNQNKNTGFSYFGNTIKTKSDHTEISRVGWCYGDLIIGYVLYQTGIVLDSCPIKHFSINMLKSTCMRREVHQSHVIDAGFCHGSSGNAHIFGKLYVMTGNPIFREASNYWIDETINFSHHKDGIGGYKSYNGVFKQYVRDFSLITGSSGIGLVLLSNITGDSDWDYYFMLN